MGVVAYRRTDDALGEVPSGAVDGVNLTFTSSATFRSGTTRVYLNGVRQKIGATYDYTEGVSLNSITFAVPPQSGDHILIDFSR